jgi:Flp pilus assembly protein TadD
VAGGVNLILHSWGSSELERGNVFNARVVTAEALRKCPDDQVLYVLAAGVEHAGGDYELARTFCLRAYELDRTDKHLYMVWPKVMAALGEKDKARVSE